MSSRHTAVALAGEARLLAAPVSNELPSSSLEEGIEDRMTFAPLAARRLAEQTALGMRIAVIELVCAGEAIEIRRARGESIDPLGAGRRGGARAPPPPAARRRIARGDPDGLDPLLADLTGGALAAWPRGTPRPAPGSGRAAEPAGAAARAEVLLLGAQRDGRRLVGAGRLRPGRKSMSTRPMRPPPNSM